MSRDILSEYGNDIPHHEAAKASSGGHKTAKDLPYDPPKGPSSQMQKGPGLHGTNHGNCGTQGKR